MLSNTKNADPGQNEQVRERLLAAAEELFSEKGFDAASVRELTKKAGCNIAAVNYYFGGKENLYLELFRSRLTAITELRLMRIEELMSRAESGVTLEELLRSFSNAFVEPLIGESRGRRFMKLMTREMIDSHLPQSLFVEKVIVPTMASLQQALRKVYPELPLEKMTVCIFSLVGQLVHLVRMKEMFDEDEEMKEIIYKLDEAIEHIVEFSAAGIRAVAEGKSDG